MAIKATPFYRQNPHSGKGGNMQQRNDNNGQNYTSIGQPPSPPAPQWNYAPPPPAKAKRGVRTWVAVVIGVVSFLIGLGVGGASKKTDSSAATAPIATSATTAAAPAPTAAAPRATTKAAPPAIVLTTKGNGIKDTASFTVGDDWTIKYTFDCTKFGTSGNFQIMVDKDITKLEANALDKSGADSTVVHGDGGKHYLSINSECDWTITVVNAG